MLFQSSPFVCILIFFYGSDSPIKPGPSRYRGFAMTLRQATLGRTPLYEWSTRRKVLHLTTQQQSQETHMSPAGFEPSIPASQRLRNHAFERAAAGIGDFYLISETNIAVLRNTDRSSAVGTGTTLRAVRSGDRIPVGARFSAPIQTGPGTYPVSCTMVIESLSMG
jgi:hypothetical protein